MTVEEAMEYFIECNENLISVAKDENVYNFEKQQIEAICSRRAFEANELALKALGLTKSGLLKDCESCRAELPPVNPSEKVGRWDHGICNNCKYDWSKDAPIASVPKYCPACGRRMEKEDSNESI